MKRNTIIIFVVVLLAVTLFAGGYFYLRQFSPRYEWLPDYRHTSEQPYGTKLLYELLKKKYGKENFILVNKKPSRVISDEEKNSLLFYVGFNTHFDSLTVEWLKKYIERGNQVCIASDYLPFSLLNSIYTIDSVSFYTRAYLAGEIETVFENKKEEKYSFHHQFRKDTAEFSWNYFSDTVVNAYRQNYVCEPLSRIDSGRVNFLKFEHGDGKLFVFTTPVLLTNYYIISGKGYSYSSDFFNQFDSFEALYWDNFNRLPQYNPNRRVLDSNNPLEFILENRSLRLSWYLILLGLLMYVLFRLKRRQNPVRIINSDKNTSIEYAKAVGLLHYKTSEHAELADRLIKLFYQYVNSRYGILQNLEKEEFIKLVSLHSEVDASQIDKLLKIHFQIKYNPAPEIRQTIQLHSELENFYKNCK